MKDWAAEWQDRLDREGRVELRQSSITPAVSLAVDIGVVVWLWRLMATEGVTYYRVIPLVLFLAGSAVSIWWLFHPTPWLVVERDRVRLNQGRDIPFSLITGVEVSPEQLALEYQPRPGSDPVVARVLAPKYQIVRVRQLASWLVRLGRGPTAQVVIEKTGRGSRMYRVRDGG